MTPPVDLSLVRRKWDAAFAGEQFVDHSLGLSPLDITLVYSSARTKYNPKNRVGCPFDDLGNQIIFPEFDGIVPDYRVIANLFPILPRHYVIVHNEHMPMCQTGCNRNDLEQMVNFSKQTGMTVYHNSGVLSASLPEHEHYQAVDGVAPIFSLDAVQLDKKGIQCGYFPGFLGANVFVDGENSPENAIIMLEEVEKMLGVCNKIIYQEKILFIPRKKHVSEILGISIGVLETIGYYPVLKEEDIVELSKDPERIKEGIQEALFPMQDVEKILKQ